MKKSNTIPCEMARGKDNRKLLPIMCMQVVILSIISVWGLWMFIGAAMEGTTLDESIYYNIILSACVVSFFVALIVAMYFATPKGSSIRRGFLTFVAAVSCIVIGFSVLSFLAAYAFKTLFHDLHWL